jgi:hypothetical protein
VKALTCANDVRALAASGYRWWIENAKAAGGEGAAPPISPRRTQLARQTLLTGATGSRHAAQSRTRCFDAIKPRAKLVEPLRDVEVAP